MTTLADIALVVALFVTGLVFMLGLANDRPAAPDRAGAAIVFFIVTPIRWVALAIALGVAIGEGGFAWISGNWGVQVLLAYAVHFAVGVASVILLATASDRSSPLAVKLACAVDAYAIPLAMMAYVAQVLNAAPVADVSDTTLRAVLLGVLALGVPLTAVAAYPELRRAARRRAADRAAREAEAQARYAERIAELHLLTDETPLEQWLDFTAPNQPEEVQREAMKRLIARPTLHEDLAALLTGAWVIEALRFVRWQMTTAPAPLALPVRDGLLRVADHLRKRIDEGEEPYPGQFELEVDQATELADRFRGGAVDFGPALIATRAALDAAPDRRFAPLQARLDACLRRL